MFSYSFSMRVDHGSSVASYSGDWCLELPSSGAIFVSSCARLMESLLVHVLHVRELLLGSGAPSLSTCFMLVTHKEVSVAREAAHNDVATTSSGSLSFFRHETCPSELRESLRVVLEESGLGVPQQAALRRFVRDAELLLDRAPEGGGTCTSEVDFSKSWHERDSVTTEVK